jgi:hypothetical protein
MSSDSHTSTDIRRTGVPSISLGLVSADTPHTAELIPPGGWRKSDDLGENLTHFSHCLTSIEIETLVVNGMPLDNVVGRIDPAGRQRADTLSLPPPRAAEQASIARHIEPDPLALVRYVGQRSEHSNSRNIWTCRGVAQEPVAGSRNGEVEAIEDLPAGAEGIFVC